MELEEKIKIATKVYFLAHENYVYSRHLTTYNNEQEFELIKKSGHLRFISHSLWRMCIIELNKLVSDSKNQKYNLHLLISEFEKNGPKERKEIYTLWRKKLDKAKTTIVILKTLRDEIYAHTDQYSFNKKIDINYDIVKGVIDLVWDILLDMNFSYSDRVVSRKLPVSQAEKLNLVQILAEH